MKTDRRDFLQALGVTGALSTFGPVVYGASARKTKKASKHFRFVHVDVFTSEPLLGNPLDVFIDARGLSDAQMLALARETHLSETTFVFPRDAATEREHGVSVRIFTPNGEVPFAGHPTLGTAAVLRNLRLAKSAHGVSEAANLGQISLDLKVGKVPVNFRAADAAGTFGEMHQVPPTFGAQLDKETIAGLHHLTSADIADEGPIQIVSTGLPFAIVPLRTLATLQSLRIDADKMSAFMTSQQSKFGFYYVTRDTGDTNVALRTRCLYVGGEDAATGSAAGCTAAWMVRHGIAAPDQSVHIRQGVEMNRASDIYVSASRDGDTIANVRVGGYTVQTMEGEVTLVAVE
jgi:trans-2,3-dihydro-3-hydroxyanthranilate isomerase